MKRLALVGALSSKFGDGAIKVVVGPPARRDQDEASSSATSRPSVSAAASSSSRTAGNERLERSARNLPGVTVIRSDSLNVVDVLDADVLLITAPSIPTMAEVYA